jgi:purine-binding chemotaxis protein CheW
MVGNDPYGLDISRVREVIKSSEITHLTKIPMVHESILGVINLRGEIIPVIDLSMRLYGRGIDGLQNKYSIIIELENEEEQMIIGAIVESSVYRKRIFWNPPDSGQRSGRSL